MMKKTLSFLLLLLSLTCNSLAQDKGFIFMIGPSVNLYYGDSEEEFTYSSDRVSFQFNGQLGYFSKKGEVNRRNMLGVFASAGTTKPGALTLMQPGNSTRDQPIVTENKFNEFYTLEGGIVIAGFLRLSGGAGRQFYTYSVSIPDNSTGFNRSKKVRSQFDYFSGTLGLVFNLDAVNWVIDANVMTGNDINNTELRLSTGFVLKF